MRANGLIRRAANRDMSEMRNPAWDFRTRKPLILLHYFEPK
jgi:hypothetical protein